MGNQVIDMMFRSFIFFIPAYLGNMMPVILGRLPRYKKIMVPVDGGKMLAGERIFGDHKTWGGLLAGILGGFFAGLLLLLFLNWRIQGDVFGGEQIHFIFQATLLGLGAILGDMLKSFFKRRLKIAPGKPFVPFDQIDLVVGSWVLVSIFYPQPIIFLVCGLIITPLLHLGANIVAFQLKWKNVWY